MPYYSQLTYSGLFYFPGAFHSLEQQTDNLGSPHQ